MRILVSTHYFSTHGGGIEIVAERLNEALVKNRNAAVEWLASDCDPIPAAAAAIKHTPIRAWNGIERYTGLPVPIWHPADARLIWRAVQEADCVHLHDALYMGNLLTFLFAKISGKPVLITQHIGAIPYRNPFFRTLHRIANRTIAHAVLAHSERVVFCSQVVADYFQSFCNFRKVPIVLANGVDGDLYAYMEGSSQPELRTMQGYPTTKPICVFVGRFVEKKGIPLLLEVARRTPHIHWLIAGDGPLEPESARLPNATVLRGLRGNSIANLYRSADLLVLPSKGEGFPLVVQEAMSCGTPCLVSPETAAGYPALQDLIFTQPLDESGRVESWTQRIEELTQDMERLRSLRSRCAQFARDHWSWRRSAGHYDSLFAQMLSG